MLFALSKSDEERLEKLFEVNENNIDILLLLRDYLVNHEKDIKSEMINNNIHQSILNFFISLYHLDEITPFIDYLDKGINVLNPSIIQDNPYCLNINFPQKTIKKWKISFDKYQPYEGFVYQSHISIKCDYYKEIPQIGFFQKEVRYPAVFENDNLWMSVTPNEINTMETPIKNAYGRCITFGLGLGYYAYMVSNKEEAESLTIVERDESVIELFKELILPQFPHKDKINIVKDDAYSYLSKTDMTSFNHIFIDLYHDASDGINCFIKSYPFLKNANTEYWIMDSIILFFRKMVISIIQDEYYGDYGEYDSYQLIYAGIKLLLKDMIFATYEQIEDLLDDESLLNLLKKISLLK